MCAFHDVLGFQAVRDVIFFNDYMKKWGKIYIYIFPSERGKSNVV